MKKMILAIAAMLPLAAGLGGCAKKTSPVAEEKQAPTVPALEPAMPSESKLLNSRPIGMVLKTTVFKMSGDYSNNVAITMDGSGQLLYYPAPTDISAASKPVQLEGGWWLNRQGLGAGSVFTKYTFEEYAALPEVPSHEELLKAVIPGARVTDFRTIGSIPASEATSRLEELNAILKE